MRRPVTRLSDASKQRRLFGHYQTAFTVLELLTTLALIVIVMGLMVSLARYVRANAADELTARILRDLEQARAVYATVLAAPPPTTLPAQVSEDSVAQQMRMSSDYPRELLRLWHGQVAEAIVRDAWGQPIGYLPQQHPMIGMAPQNRPFFFSAGPDGKYLTRQDNLYSYEQTPPGQSLSPGLPVPQRPGGGQGE